MSGIILKEVEDIIGDLNEGLEYFEKERFALIGLFGQKSQFDELSEEEYELLVDLLDDATWVLENLRQRLSKLPLNHKRKRQDVEQQEEVHGV